MTIWHYSISDSNCIVTDEYSHLNALHFNAPDFSGFIKMFLNNVTTNWQIWNQYGNINKPIHSDKSIDIWIQYQMKRWYWSVRWQTCKKLIFSKPSLLSQKTQFVSLNLKDKNESQWTALWHGIAEKFDPEYVQGAIRMQESLTRGCVSGRTPRDKQELF